MVDAGWTQLNFTSGMSAANNNWIPSHSRQLPNMGMQLPNTGMQLPNMGMYQQNQLQFNLDVASNPANVAARFRNPGPLVIEKLGGGGQRVQDATPQVPPLKFSAVSEDRLSLAIQMARRDLKNKMREDQQRQQMEAIEAAEAKAQKGKKRTKKGQIAKGKTKKAIQEGRVIAAKQLPIRERVPKGSSHSVQTQTPKKKHQLHVRRQGHSPDVPQHGLVLHLTPRQDADDTGRRRRRMDDVTPPSKESRVAESPISQQAREIKRLRQELKEYIGRIEQLSKKASQNIPKDVKSKLEQDEVDEDETKRKAVRKAEQASRSARLLYSLQQQVREIQEELERLGPGQIRHTKKSRAMNRLAAAHRGAVRALQAFVHHLPEQADAQGGLPPQYQELALLIRQLSLCCAQLEIGESGVPDGVMNILEQAKGLEDVLERQLKSPPRTSRSVNQQVSPRRRLAFEQPTSATGYHVRSPSQGRQTRAQSGQQRVVFNDQRIFGSSPSKDLPVRDTDQYQSAPLLYTQQGPSNNERLRRDIALHTATPGSPERNSVLRAGLQALLRAEANQSSPQPIRNPVTKDIGRLPSSQPMRNPISSDANRVPSSQPIRTQIRRPPANRKAPSKRPLPSGRSLLLPAKLKADRERIQRSRAALKDAHFTLATKSSIAKQQPIKTDPKSTEDDDHHTPPLSPKPAWTPPGTPRSFHKVSTPRKEADEEQGTEVVSPRSRGQRSRVHFKESDRFEEDEGMRKGGLDAKTAEREIARQAWLDSEVARRLNELDELRKNEMEQLQKLREEIAQPSQWIDEAERAVKERLQPIINKAQKLSQEHNRSTFMSSQSVGHQLSKRALDKASNQGDLLSDLILEEILEDTAREMQRIEHRADISRQAKQMQDAPTVEGLLQTLHIMEAEEEAIRRRWKKVSYADSDPDMHRSHLPQTHTERVSSVRDEWMTGTPLEGALLERLSGDVPQQHTSMVYTNVPRNIRETSSDADSESINSAARDTETRWAHPRQQPERSHNAHFVASRGLGRESAARERHFDDVGDTRTDYPHRRADLVGRTTLERPKYPLFVSTEMKKRSEQYRERFDRHLKRKSHQTIGTFDPWSLCDELADEILNDILDQVTTEVSDTMASCVDDLYKTEFDMTS